VPGGVRNIAISWSFLFQINLRPCWGQVMLFGGGLTGGIGNSKTECMSSHSKYYSYWKNVQSYQHADPRRANVSSIAFVAT